MGTTVLRGISTALVVTVLTLLAGLLWNAMGFTGLSASGLVDIGLVVSCLIGGYRAGKESGLWVSGAITGSGYVGVGVMLLALFAPVRMVGIVQVLAEAVILGAIAGAFGAGGKQLRLTGTLRKSRPYVKNRSFYTPGRSYYSDSRDKTETISAEDSDSYVWQELETEALSSEQRRPDQAVDRPEPDTGEDWPQTTESWPAGSRKASRIHSMMDGDFGPGGVQIGEPAADEVAAAAGWGRTQRVESRPWWEEDKKWD